MPIPGPLAIAGPCLSDTGGTDSVNTRPLILTKLAQVEQKQLGWTLSLNFRREDQIFLPLEIQT